jgi:transposase
MHRLQELVRLHRLGTGARRVARLLSMSPNTERSYRQALEAAGLLKGPEEELPSLEELQAAVLRAHPRRPPPAHELSSIETWRGSVEHWMDKGLGARAIHGRLREEDEEFPGSYWAVRRLCSRIKAERGVRAEEVAIPVETKPGEVAQVDFGYIGKLLCTRTHVLRKAWVFVMVLGYSRHMYAEVVFDQKTTTWLALHRRAFEAFGGVVETVVPDNLKAAVIRTAFGANDETGLNRSYRELARHYGFKVDPTPPFQPQKKGKVESAVKYLKRSVLAGRDGEEVTSVNQALTRWLEDVAGRRIHGTTREQPLELFYRDEQPSLRPLPKVPYESIEWKQARVHRDTHVCFDKRLYSVPWRWVGKTVWIQATSATVAIFAENVRIATHSRTDKGMRSTTESHLPEHRRDLRHRSRSYWEQRASAIGSQTAGLVADVFDADDVLQQLRKVQAIVTHLEGFPVERAEAASRRARFYGTYSYQGVKSILAKALDFEPLPVALVPTPAPHPPRFARTASELLDAYSEGTHEPH